MGSPNVDFFIREVRECLSGDMIVIRRVYFVHTDTRNLMTNSLHRLGSCGCLTDLPVGTMVVPKGSVSVTRNYDYDFSTGISESELPYRISKPVSKSKNSIMKILTHELGLR